MPVGPRARVRSRPMVVGRPDTLRRFLTGAGSFVLLLLYLPACASSRLDFAREYDRTREAIWRGEFADAQKLAEAAGQQAVIARNPVWQWRFRFLVAEIAILRR